LNLLERTRRLLQGLTPASPAKVQYYSVACPEGHRLRGERTEGYQALRCPTCGEGIFVLPRSPLPEPVAPESAPESRSARDPVEGEREDEPVRLSDPISASSPDEPDVDGEIEWVDPTPAAGPSPSRRELSPGETSDFFESLSVAEGETPAPADNKRQRAKTKQTPGARPGRQASGTPRGGKVDREPPRIAVAPRVSVAEWARRRRNPLIFLAVALIVAGTVGYRIWRSKFQDLPRIVEIGREQGLAALDAGDFDTAHQLLSEAKRAVDALGDAVEGAAEVRHGAEEAAVYTTLCQEPLERIIVEASADQEEWSSRFATFYKGRSIFLDATVERVPDGTGGGSYDLDYRILPDGEGTRPNLRVGRIDLTDFRLFELTTPKKGDHVQFGARLASFTYDRVNKEWLVGLEPESGVFLTHPKALEAIGRPVPDEVPGEEFP
jgi:DNA-directed RNA polymerase subunit RPC12/RpoP